MDYLQVLMIVDGRGKPLRFTTEGGRNPDGFAIVDVLPVLAFVTSFVSTTLLVILMFLFDDVVTDVLGFNGLYKYVPCALFLDDDDDILYTIYSKIDSSKGIEKEK